MDAEKLVRQIRKPELNQHDFELTEEEAVVLLTRTIEEETQTYRMREIVETGTDDDVRDEISHGECV